MNPFEGKVVIITGASEGIGAHLAAVLAARGANLVLAARNEAKLCAIATPNACIVPGDLTVESTRRAVIAEAARRFGTIDILINNAGRGAYYAPSEAPLDDARAMFELNLFAPLHLSQLATPFLKQTRGTIVNVISIAGQISLPWLSLYSASKFALTSLTSTQRMELRSHGVNVMGVFPGYVQTDFQDHAAGARPPARVVQGKRFAVSAEECAAAILRGIERRSETVVTPRAGWALVLLNRFLPALVESRMERV